MLLNFWDLMGSGVSNTPWPSQNFFHNTFDNLPASEYWLLYCYNGNITSVNIIWEKDKTRQSFCFLYISEPWKVQNNIKTISKGTQLRPTNSNSFELTIGYLLSVIVVTGGNMSGKQPSQSLPNCNFCLKQIEWENILSTCFASSWLVRFWEYFQLT